MIDPFHHDPITAALAQALLDQSDLETRIYEGEQGLTFQLLRTERLINALRAQLGMERER